MVTKIKKQDEGKRKKGRVKVLNLRKETVKDFTDEEAKQIKGGTVRNCAANLGSSYQSKLL